MKIRVSPFVLAGLLLCGCEDKASAPAFVTGGQSSGQLSASSGTSSLPSGKGPAGGASSAASTNGQNSSGTSSSPAGVGLAPSPLCRGRENGAFCGDFAVCIDERCLPSVCGDGVVHPGHEQCEDGNRERLDGCDACLFEICGDGLLQPGEECDDGNNIREDRCDSTCKRTAKEPCGNGQLDPLEECDDGNVINDDGCRNDCRKPSGPLCGNKIIDPGESCDDGNTRENDGCGSTCQKEVCGDGLVRAATEQCDDGNLVDKDGCSSSCKVEFATCGNGIVEGAEHCDDGNNLTNDDCPNDCKHAVCGDSVVEGKETCDDGNQVAGDGCDEKCARETRCGNGIVEFLAGEHCDDGNDENFDRCANNCRFPECGDNFVSGTLEECDGTVVPEGQVCDENCFIKPVCGNGIVERSKHHLKLSEACDDGNTKDGDTCAKDCRNIDLSRCGDGVVDAQLGETCDLGEETSDNEKICHDCRWTFFDQECSECLAQTNLSVDIQNLCLPGTADPCVNVLNCFVEERCVNSRTGPLSCSCGELDPDACGKAEEFPGPCYSVALKHSYKIGGKVNVVLSDKGEFLTNMLKRDRPLGRASLTAVNIARPTFQKCPEKCAKYLEPTE